MVLELCPLCLDCTVKHSLNIFCFYTAVPKMNPTSRPVPNRNQGISSQRGDAGRVEELSTQVSFSYRPGFVILCPEVSLTCVHS
jgi:hypothetical protein